ncbi:MAG: flagellin lysine-N-methylase [Sarcina sp.]
MNTLKIINYDKFKCTADKCKFTCCSGWDVTIDDNTYEKWKNDSSAKYIMNNIIFKSSDHEAEEGYIVDKKTSAPCPFLDTKGLCEIVKSHGEEYLSNTCHSFPRIENSFKKRNELTLSCACPEVVEIISNSNDIVGFDSTTNDTDNIILKIRDTLVNIVKFEGIDLEYKLLSAYEMLVKFLDKDDLTEDFVEKVMDQYNDISYIKDIVSDYKAASFNIVESTEEFNSFFIDITENYKDVQLLKSTLSPIFDFANETNVEDLAIDWNNFKDAYKEHSLLLQNCIISKILSNCVSDDVEELTNAMQMIILDYLLARYASFLKYSMNSDKTISLADVKDYIVVFSRVIGNNTDAVADFLEESFDDYILEIGYLSFISLY